MVGKISVALIAGLLSTTLASASTSTQDNWSYSGNNGPANWHQLSPANSQCRSGKSQSPINIEGTDPAIMHRLITDYGVAPLSLKNKRIRVEMDYVPGNLLKVGAKVFVLKTLDFHTPAEHQIAGKTYPMSIQFKHRAADGSWAIIETLVKEGRENLAAQEMWDHLPLEPNQNVKRAKVLINARDLMPTDKSYYRYMGSLTTPPCSEGVSWYILKRPIELSKSQIELIRGIVGGDTARPLQARNNRMILDARPQ